MSRARLFLLDGMALAYRAHFAFINSQLRNAEGLSTGPVFGFANTLERLMEAEKPTHIAVAWDTHAPTFRHRMDENYKANRPPMPDELRAGIPVIKELLALYQIPNLELDGYEADDIIGTIARTAEKEDVDVYLVTPDKDFMQLVDDHISLYKPLNNGEGFDIVGRAGVMDYFGVQPEKVIDVLALIGDASDNVPGVPGVGKKTAPKLIDEYGDMERLLAAAPAMKPSKLRENLIQSAGQARLAYQMVTIYTEVPGVPEWRAFALNPFERAKLSAFYDRMQFRTLARKYGSGQAAPAAAGQQNLFEAFEETASGPEAAGGLQSYDAGRQHYHTVDSIEKLRDLISILMSSEAFCMDTETTSPDPLSAALVGLSFSAAPSTGFYVPWLQEGMSSEEIKNSIQPVLESGRLKIGHNLKYDLHILERHGFKVNGPLFDTMIAAFLCDTDAGLSMDALSAAVLGYRPIPISDLIGSGKSQKTMDQVPVDQVAVYAAEDADITFQLFEYFQKKLKELELEKVAYEVEFPLIPVIARMERLGISIDSAMLNAYSKSLRDEMIELEQQIYEKAGQSFNINSPQQLGEILFEKMKLPSGRKTATGKYSTSEDVLATLAVQYPLPALILEYRSLSKLKSTYVDVFPSLADEDGRIHTSFNQAVAATGRLSSSNPNLQNIPIRTARGQEVRKAFVPKPGCVLISADYSQIELRVIAEISKDEAMMDAFVKGEDIHARTAKEIFNLGSLEEVTKDHRRKAKEVNFGIPYGVSAYGLAQRLGLTNEEGKQIIKEYFARFPSVRNYINESVQFARDHGFVKTLTGRRRNIPNIHSKNVNERGFAERTSINSPIQGSAADLIKLAMIHVDKALMEAGLKTRMVLQIHDELVFEAPLEEAEQASKIISHAMENALPLTVPVKADVGLGKDWLEAH